MVPLLPTAYCCLLLATLDGLADQAHNGEFVVGELAQLGGKKRGERKEGHSKFIFAFVTKRKGGHSKLIFADPTLSMTPQTHSSDARRYGWDSANAAGRSEEGFFGRGILVGLFDSGCPQRNE